MDALISKADSLGAVQRHRKHQKVPKTKTSEPQDPSKLAGPSKTKPDDSTAASLGSRTELPKSLRAGSPPPGNTKSHRHVKNKKLRLELERQSTKAARAQKAVVESAIVTDAIGADAGQIQLDGEIERTWRLGQSDIVREVGAEAALQRKEWKLEDGPYRCNYTRNGRHLAIVGKTGHVASFDWQTGTIHAELQLRESCRDITYLHDQSHFAVAQKKYVYIYDQNGVELHKLAQHQEPHRLEFLPYHWLLASIGSSGHLKYQDTSTGQLVASHRTGFGPCETLAQNKHTAVLYLGHHNGRVTLWTPNLAHPAVTLQAHRGRVSSVAIDPRDMGRYLATTGVDGQVKVWDCRMWKTVREWASRSGGGEVQWSASGILAVSSGGTVNTYKAPHNHTPAPGNNTFAPPPLYLTHAIPSRPLSSLRFCPFTDVLTIGHAKGLSNILVPGAGEAHFDSTEADPFEGTRMRREREVRGLLDKISPEMITVTGPAPGTLVPTPKLTLPGGEGLVADVPFARQSRIDRLKLTGKYDAHGEGQEDGEEDAKMQMEGGDEGVGEGEEGKDGKKPPKSRVEKKMRGKNKSMKRFLRKHRKNVIDPQTVAIRTKLEKQRAERRRALEQSGGGATIGSGGASEQRVVVSSVLDRFRRAPGS